MMFEFIVNKLLLILTLVLLLLQATEEAMDVEYEEQEYQGKNADANGPSSQASKVKKLVEPRYFFWKNYTRTKESRDKCICHHCQKTFSCASKSGTSNLKKHLQICKEHQVWLTSQKKINSNLVVKEIWRHLKCLRRFSKKLVTSF